LPAASTRTETKESPEKLARLSGAAANFLGSGWGPLEAGTWATTRLDKALAPRLDGRNLDSALG
jgi:hypothetical protein